MVDGRKEEGREGERERGKRDRERTSFIVTSFFVSLLNCLNLLQDHYFYNSITRIFSLI
jgi:hypothetical protein